MVLLYESSINTACYQLLFCVQLNNNNNNLLGSIFCTLLFETGTSSGTFSGAAKQFKLYGLSLLS